MIHKALPILHKPAQVVYFRRYLCGSSWKDLHMIAGYGFGFVNERQSKRRLLVQGIVNFGIAAQLLQGAH